jgi:hypothetical protein
MAKTAFDKIKAGLEDAIAFAGSSLLRPLSRRTSIARFASLKQVRRMHAHEEHASAWRSRDERS